MTIKQFLLTAAAAAILATTGAAADPTDHHDRGPGWSDRHDRDDARGHDRDGARGRDRGDWHGREAWHWRDDRGAWHGDRDRYWRHGYGHYVGRDRVFFELRRNHFKRWDGAPYWFQGRYVIRSYDRRGRPVIVEMNPYTGSFIGIVRF
jgi:hypothetical protein